MLFQRWTEKETIRATFRAAYENATNKYPKEIIEKYGDEICECDMSDREIDMIIAKTLKNEKKFTAKRITRFTDLAIKEIQKL